MMANKTHKSEGVYCGQTGGQNPISCFPLIWTGSFGRICGPALLWWAVIDGWKHGIEETIQSGMAVRGK
jgi:hypothetical protein